MERIKLKESTSETFALVAKMITIWIFLDNAAKHNHEILQIDGHNVFLHGDLDDEIYMQVPSGF